ncbi:MAG: hypothetical protein M1812_006610 [Candelaria pacifica]|nr:MAG: hypothetical protein M1812_006610 [Candelaria pacifica]
MQSKVYCEGESVVKRFHGIESNLRIEPIAKTNQTTTPTLAPASIENARATGETSSHVRNRHASLNNNSVVGIAASRVYSDNQRKWNTLEATNVMTTMINGTGPIDADKVIKGMITMVNAMGKTIEAAKAIELITAFNDELTTLHAAKAVNLSTTLDAATKMELEWLGYKAKHIEGRI